MPLSAKNESPKAAGHGIHPDNISSCARIYDPDSKRGEGQFSSLHLNLSAPHQPRRLLSGSFSEHVKICSAEALKAG